MCVCVHLYFKLLHILVDKITVCLVGGFKLVRTFFHFHQKNVRVKFLKNVSLPFEGPSQSMTHVTNTKGRSAAETRGGGINVITMMAFD